MPKKIDEQLSSPAVLLVTDSPGRQGERAALDAGRPWLAAASRREDDLLDAIRDLASGNRAAAATTMPEVSAGAVDRAMKSHGLEPVALHSSFRPT